MNGRDGVVTPAAVAANFICILGLFDDRSFRRMQPVIAKLETEIAGATIMVGVVRVEGQVTEQADGDFVASIGDFCSAIGTRS